MDEKYQACMEELVRWFVQHRRNTTPSDLIAIVSRHFDDFQDQRAFVLHLVSNKGLQEFEALLRKEYTDAQAS